MPEPGLESATHPAQPSFVRCNDLVVAAEYEPILRAHELDSLDALFDAPEAELLGKPGLSPWRERLRLTLEHDGIRHTLYLKRFANPPASARRALRGLDVKASSLAGVEWEWMNRLARDRIACASPVALGEELNGSRELRSVIVTASVPGRSLETWVEQQRGGTAPPLRPILVPLADLVSRFHRLGYTHSDLYLSHVFWDSTSPAESSLCLIDLQRIKRPRRRMLRWIIKDLAALNFSTPPEAASIADRIRWLKHYLGLTGLDLDAKRLIYRVAGKTLRIARHERRRQARLRSRS